MIKNKNLWIWALAVFFLVSFYDLAKFTDLGVRYTPVLFSDLLDEVESGQVSKVNIRGSLIKGDRGDGTHFSTYSPLYPKIIDILKSNNVKIEILPLETPWGSFIGLLLSWFPIILLIGVWFFFMRQMQGSMKGGGGALGFGKSKARLMDASSKKITFNDVAGIDEAKEELTEIVDFLKQPDKFSALGGKIPKGCLLIGSPGTGKTLLARAVAGEANVPFFSISGSDFVEMFVGVGASRVRDLFDQGKKNSPCLIFIDEIDAVGRHRGAGLGGGNDEREQTLNQLLVEMDGFEENTGIIIIAATNRPDVLDPALLRPGRFDRQIVVPLPDILGREQILKVHMAKVPVGPDVNTSVIARGTPGFTGADLANIVNEAALYSAGNNRKVITMSDLEHAKDKVMMGSERKSMLMDDEEKKLTAYHEAGHAIVAFYTEASDPIHKATIIPRGRALGMVMRLPKKDKLSLTREKAKADMDVAMGGRVAEEMIFGYDKVTSGASSDIKMATSMSRHMVTEWGMSDKIGPLCYADESHEVFLGRQVQNGHGLSEETVKTIDSEVKSLVEESYKKAEFLLKKHSDDLKLLAEALLEYETLTGDEIKRLLSGEKDIKKDKDDKTKPNKPVKLSSVPISDKVVNPVKKKQDVKAGEKEKEKKKKAGGKKKPALEGGA